MNVAGTGSPQVLDRLAFAGQMYGQIIQQAWFHSDEVFMSWIIQRLPHRTKQEIEKMLIGELPELVETRAGQDILKIGKEQGLAEGLVRAVFVLLGGKRGRLTKDLGQRIQKLTNDQLCERLAEADACKP